MLLFRGKPLHTNEMRLLFDRALCSLQSAYPSAEERAQEETTFYSNVMIKARNGYHICE